MTPRPDDNLADRLRRGEFEKTEEQELEDLEDSFEDLVGSQTPNSEVAGQAEAVRDHRKTEELEQDELEDMLDVDFRDRDFLGSMPGPGGGGGVATMSKSQTTADEPDAEDETPAAASPPVDEDEPGRLLVGETWSSPLLATPEPIAAAELDESDWVARAEDPASDDH